MRQNTILSTTYSTLERHYNSYRGTVGGNEESVIAFDFQAGAPYQILLQIYITEFCLCAHIEPI